MAARAFSVLAALLCGLAVVLGGCGDGAGPDVAEGRYRLYVQGSVTDTLTGPARARPLRDGHLGIELGLRSGPGMSIEITASGATGASRLPVGPGRYEAVAASLLESTAADSLAGLIAFLDVAERRFAATRGHLSLTHVDDETVGGTLDLEMTDRASPSSAEQTVRVTGVLRAITP